MPSALQYRRPWPKSASSIGTWQYFLSLMSSLSVITNTALILFTTDIPELPQSIAASGSHSWRGTIRS